MGDEKETIDSAERNRRAAAYPEQVAALRSISAMRSDQGRHDAICAADRLLAKLGEDN